MNLKILLFSMLFLATLTSSAPSGAMTIEEAIKKLAEISQRNVPQRLGKYTTLAQVSYVDSHIMFSYILHANRDQLLSGIEEDRMLGQREKIGHLCLNKDPRWILDHGGIFTFSFSSQDGYHLYSFSVDESLCE